VPDREPLALYEYQRSGAAWLATKRTAALCDEMGCGKTPQAIAAADLIGAKNILIAAPAIARMLWRREFETWQRIGRSVQIVESASDAKNLTGDTVVVSYSLLPKVRALLCGRSWDLLVCDEAQALNRVEPSAPMRKVRKYSARKGCPTFAGVRTDAEGPEVFSTKGLSNFCWRALEHRLRSSAKASR
jgi:SNF2 family DNA or RNA helicase